MKERIASAVIESMSDGLLVLDFQGTIRRINQAALRILNLTETDLRDKSYGQLFLELPENDAFNDILLDGIQRGETRGYREVPFLRRDGRTVDLAVTTSFLKEEGGADVSGIVVVFKDITETKALERARNRVMDHLSHELRTPISIVLASVKRLKRPDTEKVVARILRNLQRLQDIQMETEDIVRQGGSQPAPVLSVGLQQALDLLDIAVESHPESCNALTTLKAQIHETIPTDASAAVDVDPADRIQTVIRETEAAAPDRQVKLEADMEPCPPLRLPPHVLDKALHTLVRNAVENTPDGGSVQVALSSGPDGARIAVRDTGVGITAESLDQIFGGFYHAQDTDLYSTKKPYAFGAGGKGLDLLRLRVMAEALSFDIRCDSRRCRYIPTERDTCPGDIEKCPHVHGDAQACAAGGGSTFELRFPSEFA